MKRDCDRTKNYYHSILFSEFAFFAEQKKYFSTIRELYIRTYKTFICSRVSICVDCGTVGFYSIRVCGLVLLVAIAICYIFFACEREKKTRFTRDHILRTLKLKTVKLSDCHPYQCFVLHHFFYIRFF